MIKISKVKDKERILKAEREKQLLTYKATPIKQSADFPAARREWHDIFKVLKEENFQPRILYLEKLFRTEGEIKVFQTTKS